MRIALLAPLVTVLDDPPRGGSQALVSDLAGGLTARGHKVDVFAATGSHVPGARVVDTGVDSESLESALFRPDRPGRPEVSRHAFARAWDLISEGDHEVVHNHAFDAPAVELARGRRVVHTLHLPPDLLVADALRAAPGTTVAAVSGPHARSWSSVNVRIDAVLRPGVPVDRIPVGAGGERVVFAGRLSPEKGAKEAIEIARRAGAAIDVYGDPYDAEYAAGVPAHPALPREELWLAMGRALAVLCPVKWDEPFGLVAAEAQAAGTPVIAYRRGGLVEVVRDGVTGALVPPGDIDGAVHALGATFSREECRCHARRSLDLRRMLDEHEELYERLA